MNIRKLLAERFKSLFMIYCAAVIEATLNLTFKSIQTMRVYFMTTFMQLLLLSRQSHSFFLCLALGTFYPLFVYISNEACASDILEAKKF